MILSHLNTLIGFASVFALLSLFVTAATQAVRQGLRMKTRALEECLLRLFGELRDGRRFVAAMLTHPSLEGARGAALFRNLTDPTKSSADVKADVEAVLGTAEAGGSLARIPWSRTGDLDKQSLKDIGTAVYERIGHLVDFSIADRMEGGASAWAPLLAHRLDTEGSGVRQYRGALWLTATAAFPEAEGKAHPLKTYVAAFHDEASSSASDDFTLRMRILSTGIAALLAFALHLDALALWNQLAKTSPEAIDRLASAALSVEQELKASTPTPGPQGSVAAPARPPAVQLRELQEAARALRESGLFAGFEPRLPLSGEMPGIVLAFVALSFGAPFWFEILKAAIGMKSAFSESQKKS